MIEPAYEWVTVFDGWKVRDEDEPMPTIREAIDAAILSQNAYVETRASQDSNPPKNHV